MSNRKKKDEAIGSAAIDGNTMLPAVAWVEIGADDFSAISACKRYYFRCEDMGSYWWWCVDFMGKEIGASYFSDKPAKTRAQAMALAEQCYLAHLNNGG